MLCIAHIPSRASHFKLIVAVIFLVIITKQRGILSPPQVLLQPSLALRIDVTLSSKQAEQDRQQDQCMCRRPQHKCDPDAEVVNLEDLCVSVELMQ
jgi:hypothetical protein